VTSRLRALRWTGLLAGSVGAIPAQAQSPAADSVLARACAWGGGLAEGLLLVAFRWDLPHAHRALVARGVGGRLGGTAEDGGVVGEYVILPPDARLDVAADRLIRMDGVESVGEVRCPAPPTPPAADSTTRADSIAGSDTAPPADSVTTPQEGT
jgi:hypothetical protein